MSSNRRMHYRADIDGLRALSIAAVLTYHVAPDKLPHGYLGVDVFFVISGFLITGIIVREMHEGRFSLALFLQRRAARLFPVLATMFLLTTPLAYIVLTQAEFEEFLRQMVAGALYVANAYFYLQAGYFEPDALRQPFLHLWSLAVEEQFYLVMPLLVLALMRLGQLRLSMALAGLAAVSLVAMLLTRDAALAFYAPWTRGWEFLAGGVLALAMMQRQWRMSGVMATALGVAGLLLVLAPMVAPIEMRHPGLITLLPVAGSLLLLATPQSLVAQRLLSLRPFVYLGLISYALYIWHYPLLSLAEYALPGGLISHGQKLAYLAVVLALAVLTHHLVEKPARVRRAAIPATVALLAMAGMGLVLQALKVEPLVRDEFVVVSAAASRDWAFPGQLQRHFGDAGRVYVNRARQPVQVAVFGDSHAQQYAPRVMHLTRNQPAGVATVSFITQGGCAPVAGFRLQHRRNDCSAELPRLLHHLAAQPLLDTIVIAGAWNRYFLDRAFLAKRGAYMLCEGRRVTHNTPQFAECLRKGLAALLNQVRQAAPRARLVFMLDNPHEERFSPEYHLRQHEYRPALFSWRVASALKLAKGKGELKKLSAFPVPGLQTKLAQELKSLVAPLVDEIIDPTPFVCPDGQCHPLFRQGNGWWYKYKDEDHFTATYARHLSILDRLLRRPHVHLEEGAGSF